jgi:hypothetical protein
VIVALSMGARTANAQTVVNETWTDADSKWSIAGNWSKGVVPNNGGGNVYNVFIQQPNSTMVTLDTSNTINNLTIGTGNTLTFDANKTLTIANAGSSVNNLGTLDIANATLSISNAKMDQLGGGTTKLDTGNISGTGVLANAGNTIQGVGEISVKIANQATIMATPVVGAGVQQLKLSGEIINNSGTLAASGEVSLFLNGSVLDSGNGRIMANDSGKVAFGDGSGMASGSLTTMNNGEIHGQGSVSFSSVTITGGLEIFC